MSSFAHGDLGQVEIMFFGVFFCVLKVKKSQVNFLISQICYACNNVCIHYKQLLGIYSNEV